MEIRVNTAAKPKQIDTKNLDGTEKGFVAVSIYELDGDTLRICHTWKGQTKRPEKFAIAKGWVRYSQCGSERRSNGENRFGRHAKPSAAERRRSRMNQVNQKQKEVESWSASQS